MISLSIRQLHVSVSFEGVPYAQLESKIQGAIDDSFKGLAEEVEWSWRQKASVQLHSSRDEYLKNLYVDSTYGQITVSLTGWLPVAVEEGADPFDMRPGLLSGHLHRVIGMSGPGHKSGHTFHTVGSASNSKNHWWHPGIMARRIGKQVEREFPGMIDAQLVPSISRISV